MKNSTQAKPFAEMTKAEAFALEFGERRRWAAEAITKGALSLASSLEEYARILRTEAEQGGSPVSTIAFLVGRIENAQREITLEVEAAKCADQVLRVLGRVSNEAK